METWLPAQGYEGLYEVSSHGRVRSLPKVAYTYAGTRARVIAGRVLKAGFDGKYYHVTPVKDGKQTTVKIHALVLNAFVGVCPQGMECRHLDGNTANNRADNLCWGTKKQNAADRERHGTKLLGCRNPNARANPDMVLSIRKMFASGKPKSHIAKMLGLGETTVSSIVSRETWAHVL